MWFFCVEVAGQRLNNPLRDDAAVEAHVAWSLALEGEAWRVLEGSVAEGYLVLQNGRKRSERITYRREA